MYVPISNKFEVDNVHLIGNSTYRMILENFSAKRRAWGGERVFFLSIAWSVCKSDLVLILIIPRILIISSNWCTKKGGERIIWI